MKTRSGKAANKVVAKKSTTKKAPIKKSTSKKAAPKKAKSLFDRLGGDYPISAVVKRFSDSLFDNKIVGRQSKNPQLAQWHIKMGETRLPGLVHLRTEWVEAKAGAKCPYSGKSLKDAHFNLKITPAEFDAVAQELENSLDFYKVPATEKVEVMNVFIAQKDDVTAGSRA